MTNSNDNTVSVISGQTNTVIGNPIPVGPPPNIAFAGPNGITFDSANGDLYVTNFCDGTVSVISGQTNAVVGSPIAVGTEPQSIAFDSANGDLYVANLGDDTVSVISGQTNTVIGNPIPVGINPDAIAFDPANGNLYVTCAGSNTVSVIATTMRMTALTLNPITNVPSGTAVTVTGKLTDSSTSSPLSGATITFSGTGAANIHSVITRADGTFTAIGVAPTTVASGWTVQAHYGGGGIHASANSPVSTYNTL